MARHGEAGAMPPGTIDTAAAVRVSGLPMRTLLRWIARGALVPACYVGEPGTKRAGYAWSLPDIVAAKAISELRRSGVSAQRVARAALVVKAHGGDFAQVRLWTNGRDVFKVVDARTLVSLLDRPGQFAVWPLADWSAAIERTFHKAVEERERKERAEARRRERVA